MRRGWILLLTLVVLFLGGGFAWWWSTPGQIWWMTKKWEWWVLPRSLAIPSGYDTQTIIGELNPQWDRLLRRKVVTPYSRVWDPAPAEEKIEAFGDQIQQRIKFTLPLP